MTRPSFLQLGTSRLNLGLLEWIRSPLSNIWPWKDRSYEFTALPLEVLAEVLKNVHWRDLLVIRQVCKRLDEISRVREVWISQYRQYVAEKEFQPTMEEPLQSYSREEIENWVLERRGADLGWGLPGRPARERTIYMKTLTPCFVVPGGRWLLCSMADGSVMSYDLDHHEILSSILIPPRENFSDVTCYFLAIDIDKAAPKLTFNLVTYPANYNGISLLGNMDIMIWSVNLCGHGSTAHLEAHFLHSFSAYQAGAYIGFLSLNGDLIARCMDEPYCSVEVFNWKLSTSSRHRKAVLYPDVEPNTVWLLPNNRLIVLGLQVILVYNVGELLDEEPTTPLPFSQSPTIPQWRHSGDYRFLIQPVVSTHKEAVSFVLPSKEQIYKLTIPHNPQENPYLTGPINADQSSTRSAAGFQKALFREGDESLVKLSFSWDSTMKKPTKQALVVSPGLTGSLCYPRNRAIQTFLVEDTGRIILYPTNFIYVLDTSKFRMNTE